MKSYNHRDIEPKWQQKWDQDELYKIENKVDGKENHYVLVEFPYPSGNAHIGHWYAFSVPDMYARFKRMQGYNTLYPFGFDSFGLPAENAAIKRGLDPKEWTDQNIADMTRQFKTMGSMIDWSRMLVASDPDYYKWTQWLFLQFFNNNIAYRAVDTVNWCPNDQTVLANEQVINGRCERCDAEVEQREQASWFLKITDYADRLIDDLDTLDWADDIKETQKNWIGRKEGAEIEFTVPQVHNKDENEVRSFIMGEKDITKKDIEAIGGKVEKITEKGFLCVSFPKTSCEEFEKLILEKMEPGFWNEYLTNDEVVFIFKHKDGKIERFILDEETDPIIRKLGNQFNNEEDNANDTTWSWLANNSWYAPIVPKIKVFTTRPDTLFGATFVVLAPEHPLVQELSYTNKDAVDAYIKESKDKTELERTAEGKEKTGVQLEGVTAINPGSKEEIPVYIADYVLPQYGTGAIMAVPAHDERDLEFAKKFNLPLKRVISEDGILEESGDFDGMESEAAKKAIVEHVGGEMKTTYRLHDWSLSRQRYWGCPIPIVYDPEGKPHAVPEEHLPWTLPTDVDFKPTGKAPLASSYELQERVEKIFGKGWTPEVDTFDTFVDSSWYFYRYTDPNNDKEFASKDALKAWIPVDRYSGGVEHTTVHLLYSRFWHKALNDLGIVEGSEPYTGRSNHGIILGSDGRKMSKRWGNIIDPDTEVGNVGADAVRMYLAFIGPYTVPSYYPWDAGGVVGVRRFLEKVWGLSEKVTETFNEDIEQVRHQTIKKVSEDLDSFKFNTAIAQLMICANAMEKEKEIGREQFASFLQILAPFAPHLTEELWEKLGHTSSIHLEVWPEYDEAKTTTSRVTVVVQVNGKVRGNLDLERGTPQEEIEEMARALPQMEKWLSGDIDKVVHVPDRLVNFVLKS